MVVNWIGFSSQLSCIGNVIKARREIQSLPRILPRFLAARNVPRASRKLCSIYLHRLPSPLDQTPSYRPWTTRSGWNRFWLLNVVERPFSLACLLLSNFVGCVGEPSVVGNSLLLSFHSVRHRVCPRTVQSWLFLDAVRLSIVWPIQCHASFDYVLGSSCPNCSVINIQRAPALAGRRPPWNTASNIAD